MDLLALLIGIIIGLLVGFAAAWAMLAMKANGNNVSATEAELKALMAEQANELLHNSHNSIERISQELESLKSGMQQYEQSMSAPANDPTANFFGEQTSLFLRNVKQSDKNRNDSSSSSDQPRDFSKGASGLFAGSPNINEQAIEEKSTN